MWEGILLDTQTTYYIQVANSALLGQYEPKVNVHHIICYSSSFRGFKDM
jgi:hypothetical protein